MITGIPYKVRVPIIGATRQCCRLGCAPSCTEFSACKPGEPALPLCSPSPSLLRALYGLLLLAWIGIAAWTRGYSLDERPDVPSAIGRVPESTDTTGRWVATTHPSGLSSKESTASVKIRFLCRAKRVRVAGESKPSTTTTTCSR